MNKFYFFSITIILSLLLSAHLSAQQSLYSKNSPEWLVDMFFKQNQFPDKVSYLTGEMLGDVDFPTIGEELPGRATVSFRKIELKNQSAVYAVDITGNGSNAVFYCFMRKESGNWKINSVRKFQLPKFVYTAADSISKITNPSATDLMLLNSLRLVTGSDENLKLYLSKNINDFYKIITVFENDDIDALNSIMDKLGLDYVYADKLYPGSVFVMVSGFGRIEAGYIYSKSGSSLPQISPDRFIYLEEVLPRWYVYRTL